MKKILFVVIFSLVVFITGLAQQNLISATEHDMDRIELCKENYTRLFGGEALNGQGNDPEMLDILQKYIFGEAFRTGDLDIKTREMITCVSLATMQQLPQLKSHAVGALNVGITPVELREAIYQCAPLIGFPKVLNVLGTLNEAFAGQGISLPLERQGTVTEEDRHEKGQAIEQYLYEDFNHESMHDLPGDMGTDVVRFRTEVHYGDFYTRSGLDLKTRELLTYCVLTVIGAEELLRTYISSNEKAGNSKEILTAAVIQCMPYIGFPAAYKALEIIRDTPGN